MLCKDSTLCVFYIHKHAQFRLSIVRSVPLNQLAAWDSGKVLVAILVAIIGVSIILLVVGALTMRICHIALLCISGDASIENSGIGLAPSATPSVVTVGIGSAKNMPASSKKLSIYNLAMVVPPRLWADLKDDQRFKSL